MESIDINTLSVELEGASAARVVARALELFAADVAISFSGAEDVLLIEYAKQSGLPFRVFSLDTGRLHPETYRFFDRVEQHYDIRIDYCQHAISALLGYLSIGEEPGRAFPPAALPQPP